MIGGRMKPPDWLTEKTIEDMKPNEVGYTVPLSLSVGINGHLYLNGKYPIHEFPSGTVNMKVKCARNNFRGYNEYEVVVDDSVTISKEPSSWAGISCPVTDVTKKTERHI
jgi:hypothetical protein